MKTTILFFLVGLLLSGFDVNVDRTITGTVRSAADGNAMPGVRVAVKGRSISAVTDASGYYSLVVPESARSLTFSLIGYVSKEVRISKSRVIDVQLDVEAPLMEEVVITGYSKQKMTREDARSSAPAYHGYAPTGDAYYISPAPVNTEEYEGVTANVFHGTTQKPLSTFSIDVDAASYSNIRRFVNDGQRPPRDAVRVEEMINYFNYDYAEPDNRHPFNVITEISRAPWNQDHQLIHIGLQGKKIPVDNLPPSNLVFLIDVSGSMNQANKLPLVKQSFGMLVDQLRPQDHVAIVVYAGAASVVLEPTAGNEKSRILAAIDRLQAGGSTAGSAGLRLAYGLAKEHFNEKGNNRVIIATDGDFNVGESSNAAMENLIEEKRKDGIYLTVLGFGMGNLKDSKMELLADKGNGNYAYIDGLNEARKVLVSEFGGTLFTIATDVKLQVEFNPERVQAYRLIGYENRLLNDEDFNNDRKDAGDLGSGHTVTALYEVIPAGVTSSFYSIDDLKYQRFPRPTGSVSRDWMTVKLRYKRPGESTSNLLQHVLAGNPLSLTQTSNDFRWSAAVAAFGMILTDSQYVNNYSCDDVVALALAARGSDVEGYRSEFINVVRTYAASNRRSNSPGK